MRERWLYAGLGLIIGLSLGGLGALVSFIGALMALGMVIYGATRLRAIRTEIKGKP